MNMYWGRRGVKLGKWWSGCICTQDFRTLACEKKKMLNRFCLNYHRIFLIYSGSERLVKNFWICCFFYPIKYGLRQVSLKRRRRKLSKQFSMWCLFFCNLLAILPYVEACVVEQLTPPTSDLDVSGSSLAHHAVSSHKEYYASLSLFSQVYKWVPAIYCWGVTLRWTSIPSRGE